MLIQSAQCTTHAQEFYSPPYLRCKRDPSRLRTLGLDIGFPHNNSDVATGITAVPLRYDLARVKMQGNWRGGYNIATMRNM